MGRRAPRSRAGGKAVPATGKLRLGNLQTPEVGLQMVLRRGSNFYLFYDHIIAGSHFTALAPWFRSRHRSFLWKRSLSLAFGRLSGLDLRPCRSLRSGFAASPRRRRGCLAKPCGLRRMSASLDFRFLRGLASTRRHSLNYSCRRGIVKRGARREDKTWSAESYWLNPNAEATLSSGESTLIWERKNGCYITFNTNKSGIVESGNDQCADH